VLQPIYHHQLILFFLLQYTCTKNLFIHSHNLRTILLVFSFHVYILMPCYLLQELLNQLYLFIISLSFIKLIFGTMKLAIVNSYVINFHKLG